MLTKIFYRIQVATLLALFSCGLSCAPCTPAQQAKLDRFECQVHALAPLVEPALDAAELARDLYAGKADLGAVLGSLNASEAEVDALLARLHECSAEPEKLPEGSPS